MVVAAPAWWVGLLLGIPAGAALMALVLALCEMAARGDRPYDQERDDG